MSEGFKAWVRKQTTFGNVMTVALLIVTLARNTGKFAFDLTSATAENTAAIQKTVESQQRLTATIDSLSLRVEGLEKNWLILNELVAKDFPRRSELEPRLRAVEEQLRENNMLSRRIYERYVSPNWKP